MKVTVWMSAFNHGKYISACLDSVLMQKTDFDFEIVIGEDCSSDNTREIIKEYAGNFPGKIITYLPEKNIGMMQMDIATFPLCRGEYLALLNGDDEWTDENKLQIQADLLDSDPGIAMCYHRSKVIDEISGQTWDTEFTGINNELPVEKLFQGFNPIMTASVMCRNIGSLPGWYGELPYGDMPLYLILSERGRISYIDRIMCLYRIHSSGNWQGDSLKRNLIKDINYYKFIDSKFGHVYSKYIKRILSLRYYTLVLLCLREDNFEEAEKYLNELKAGDSDFLDSKKNEISDMNKIIHENSDKRSYMELINSDPGWKVS
ncbi:MAG: glycosyltransferase [Bacteroidetes bacterium]|nr:glycosyltransferase [Bacteroidota bacterium]